MPWWLRPVAQCAHVWVFLIYGSAAALDSSAAPPPNIVIIYADDLGYGDLQCYNPERGKIPTPNIDSLAAAGMRFTDGHSSSAVCSPSRYTLLTGRYHWRTRLQKGIVRHWEPPLIAAERLTLAGLLKQQGYQTACVGKWHLGWDWAIEEGTKQLFTSKREEQEPTPEHLAAWQHTFSRPIEGGPTARGFDEYFGTDVPNWPPYCFIEKDRTLGIPTQFLPERLLVRKLAGTPGPAILGWELEPILPALGKRACDFINRKSKAEQPFFLYMPLTAPHTPIAVDDRWKGKSELGDYGDFVIELDSIVGQVLDALETTGVAQNTLVVFTSDNGFAPIAGRADIEAQGHFPSGPLRGYKAEVWEGGHRVPFVVRWPEQVAPGSVCHQLVHQADLLATCAAIVATELPSTAGEDSFSLLPLLQGSDAPVRDHTINQAFSGLLSIRQDPWKLVFGPGGGGWSKERDEHAAQLYNLENDLGETKNLYTEHPEKVAELTALMQKLVTNGRSTPGPKQTNDVEVNWQRFIK